MTPARFESEIEGILGGLGRVIRRIHAEEGGADGVGEAIVGAFSSPCGLRRRSAGGGR